jgi:hypothetical protein
MSVRVLALGLLAILPRLLSGQGVTSAAIQGTVSRDDGAPIDRATVRIINEANGRRWHVVTGSTGRFLVEDAAVGGPYRIEVRALGFAPEARSGIKLALGQRLVADFALRPAAVTLSSVNVTAVADPILNPGRTGPAEVIPRSVIAAMPNRGRDFLSLTLLAPQVASSPSTPAVATSGVSVGGQNRVYNSFQVDGGLNQDLYRGQLPGRTTLPRPISLEALEEIQVLSAPFDVRHGAFVGGVVNAVTRSGTNTARGSVFFNVGHGSLVGKNVTANAVEDFATWQYGATIEGPIVRDRAHFFLSVDLQQRVVPDPGPLISDTVGGADMARIGVSYASATRFQQILRDTYRVDPGTLGPVEARIPSQDVFAKITSQPAMNHHVEASYHYAHGNREGFLVRARDIYRLSSTAEENPSTVHASRLIWTSLLGSRWSNELIVSHLRLLDRCETAGRFTGIAVRADRGRLDAGQAFNCAPNSLTQDALEVRDNVTFGLGPHTFSFGAHLEALRFRDDLVPNSPGVWHFSSLDSLESGRANRYEIALRELSNRGVDFRVPQVGMYAQDRWRLTRALTLTAGLRLDIPFLPDAMVTNDSLGAALGIDTGRLPSGNVLWSPRVGFNYDVRAQSSTFLRGGVGVFSGRPPFRWIGNAYRDGGLQELFLRCTGSAVPAFDVRNQPSTCADGSGPAGRLSYFDPDTRFPQNLKATLGVDHRFPAGVIGTIDALYTRALNQLYTVDANLLPPVGVAHGEADRPLYGTFSASGQARPARRVSSFDQVIRVMNASGDNAFSLSAQLRKSFGDQIETSALYAYTRARDRMSLAHLQARANVEGSPLDGTLDDRRLATSLFEIPHRVQVTAGARLPYAVHVWLLYAGASGRPFTYIGEGDANADGFGVSMFQDPVYVPRVSAPGGDVSLVVPASGGFRPAPDSVYAALERYIEGEGCLRAQRGRVLARNSCRNPWFGTLNARLTNELPTRTGQALQLTADVYNVPNLLNRRWGASRFTAITWAQTLLRFTGYDAGAGRGLYQLLLPARSQIEELASRWEIELGARYVF